MDDQPFPPSESPTGLSRITSSPWFYVGLGWLIGLALFACVGVIAGLTIFRPQLTTLLAGREPTPTPACGLPTIAIGGTTFFILPVQRGADGSVDVPEDSPVIAYWIEGTIVHPAFGLSRTPENIAMKGSLKAGDPVKITWENCNSSVYAIASVEDGPPDPAELQEVDTPGVSVFLQAGPADEGYVLRGSLEEETLTTVPATAPSVGPAGSGSTQEPTGELFPTAAPDDEGRLAEISLLETKTSADGSQLLLNVSLYNYGESAISLSFQDILIIPEDAPTGTAAFSLLDAEPKLPAKITPGETRPFTFTFPRPPTPAATLKIFEAELYFDGY